MIGKTLAAPALALAILQPALSQDRRLDVPPITLSVTEGEDIRFTRLSTQEGLSQSRVRHIVQDDQGFMWFGTEDGLNRYDGYRFKVFRHDRTLNSLSGVAIRALYKDRLGMLWIGVDQFLDKFDPATETFTHYRPGGGDPASLGGEVFSICQDRAGVLWLATNHGLDKLDPVSGRFTHYRHNPSDPASLSSDDLAFVMEDRAGALWIASTTGLDSLDPQTGKITHYLQFESEVESALLPDTTLYQDRSGVLWVISSSGSGLATFDPTTRKLTRYSFHEEEPDPAEQAGVYSIHEDEDGMFWLGTVGSGLIKFDRMHNTFIRYRYKPGVPGSLSNNFVLSLFEDREGSIWAGTGGGGVNRFPKKPTPFRTYRKEPANPNSLDQNFVLSVYEDSRGILWIGTDNTLNRLDRKTRKYTFYRHNPSDSGSISNGSVTSAIEDEAGFLWFGTYGGGLNRFDRRTGRFKAYRNHPADSRSLSSDRVLTVFIDHTHTLWIGTGDGLNRFDPKTEQFTIFREDPPIPISQIAEDREGILWLGTIGGGFGRFDPATGQFTVYRHDPNNAASLSNDRVNGLCINKAGAIWVGTQNGLDKFDPQTHAFTGVYFESNGLPSNAVQGIQEDERVNLWVSTNNGLSRFQPRDTKFTNYYDSDGLAGNDFGVFIAVTSKSASGELFFGGVEGITAFYPDKLDEFTNAYVPPVVLTDFRLNNGSVPIGSNVNSLTLSHKQSVFSLEFSALSYFSPARNRYRYKLEGLDNDWYEAGSDRRFVTYTTLPPRDYTFRVQGSNNFGTWNEKGASIRIRITPPWWSTWWFRMACAALFSVLVWSAYYYRLHQFAQQYKTRLEERTRIAQELHDTLLQGFLSASMQLNVAVDNLPTDSPVKPPLDRVLQLMNRVIEEGRNTLRGLRSSDNGMLDLEQAFSRVQEELAVRDNVGFRVIVDGRPRPLRPILRDEVYRIGREALVNAFCHSQAKSVELEMEYAASELRILVRDNGCGIDPQAIETGREGHWGLTGMRERAERIGGRLHVWSSATAGTEVELSVPSHIAFQFLPADGRLKWFGRLYPRGSGTKPLKAKNGRYI